MEYILKETQGKREGVPLRLCMVEYAAAAAAAAGSGVNRPGAIRLWVRILKELSTLKAAAFKHASLTRTKANRASNRLRPTSLRPIFRAWDSYYRNIAVGYRLGHILLLGTKVVPPKKTCSQARCLRNETTTPSKPSVRPTKRRPSRKVCHSMSLLGSYP